MEHDLNEWQEFGCSITNYLIDNENPLYGYQARTVSGFFICADPFPVPPDTRCQTHNGRKKETRSAVLRLIAPVSHRKRIDVRRCLSIADGSRNATMILVALATFHVFASRAVRRDLARRRTRQPGEAAKVPMPSDAAHSSATNGNMMAFSDARTPFSACNISSCCLSVMPSDQRSPRFRPVGYTTRSPDTGPRFAPNGNPRTARVNRFFLLLTR